jgi:hypothetical protein
MESLQNKIKEAVRGRKFILKPTPGGEENFESDVVYVPDFEILLKDINRALDTLRTIATDPEIISDPKFGEIYNQFRLLRNNLRTHMRKNYPTEYQKIKGMFEISAVGGGTATFNPGIGANYAVPAAFNPNKKDKGTKHKYYYKLGMKPVTETNPGATLGPGPKAGEKGVKNNYYVKNFGYKEVDPVKLAAKSKAIDTNYLWGKP